MSRAARWGAGLFSKIKLSKMGVKTSNYTCALEHETTDWKGYLRIIESNINRLEKTIRPEQLQDQIGKYIKAFVSWYNSNQPAKPIISGNGSSHYYISWDGPTENKSLGELMERRLVFIQFKNDYEQAAA